MKIIRNKTTNIVLYKFNDNDVVKLGNHLNTQSFNAIDVNSYENEIIENVEDIYPFIGGAYSYNGSWFIERQDLIDNKTLSDLKAKVPTKITMRQARLALLESGLLTTVTDAIANGTDEEMKIEWEYATDVRRDWQSLITMSESLGMTSTQLDDLFILAGTK